MKRPAEEQLESDTVKIQALEEDGQIIRKKVKKTVQNARQDLKKEILDTYNAVTGKALQKFGDIADPYTIVETYLMTQTGAEKGLRNTVFAAVFNDKIKAIRTNWMKDCEKFDEQLRQKWDIPLVQSRSDVDQALATVFLLKHCYNKQTNEFFVNALNFLELREAIKYEVIRVLRSWGVEGAEELEKYMTLPKYLEGMTMYAHELHRAGVQYITLNFNTETLITTSSYAQAIKK